METKLTRMKGTQDFEREEGGTYIGNGIIAREILGGGGKGSGHRKATEPTEGENSVTK
jgi:hypothetical protein